MPRRFAVGDQVCIRAGRNPLSLQETWPRFRGRTGAVIMVIGTSTAWRSARFAIARTARPKAATSCGSSLTRCVGRRRRKRRAANTTCPVSTHRQGHNVAQNALLVVLVLVVEIVVVAVVERVELAVVDHTALGHRQLPATPTGRSFPHGARPGRTPGKPRPPGSASRGPRPSAASRRRTQVLRARLHAIKHTDHW